MRRVLRLAPPVLLVAAVVEIAVFVLLGQAIGYGWALLLVLAASLAGLFLLRREGMRAWRGFRAAAQAGRPPGEQVTEGLVGLAAGVLLAMPGLLSGAVGLLLVVPPVRRLARGVVQRTAERRVSSMVAGDLFGPRRVRVRPGQPTAAAPDEQPTAPPRPVTPISGEVVEGEIVDR